MLFDRDHALIALGRVMIKKGLITKAEVKAELEEVNKEIYQRRFSRNGRDKVGEKEIRTSSK